MPISTWEQRSTIWPLNFASDVLKYNQSCSKAWEHRGRIMEEEHSYKDAADFYEKAWFYGQEASSTVGYKLAFNYLKAHRYIDAIDVCHRVLNKHPDVTKNSRRDFGPCTTSTAFVEQ